MIIGAHSIIYSRSPEADRALLREVFELPHVDVGDGWLIFGLPPAELAVHPSETNDVHEFYLMSVDIVGHQVELMHVVRLRWMDGQFGRRQTEDQPAIAHIDVWELEHLAQQGAVGRGVLTVEDRMRADNHDGQPPNGSRVSCGRPARRAP